MSEWHPLSPIDRIKILTYLIWGFLGAAIFDCIIRSCDLFYWFIQTCLGPTVVPATISSLELFCVLTMCYFSDNVSSKGNIKILWLVFMPPTLKKLIGHIAFGACVGGCVGAWVTLFVPTVTF